MFELVKILNKNNNSPDIELQKLHAASSCEPGMIFTLFNGYLGSNANDPNHEGAHYCTVEAVGPTENEKTVKCFRVFKEMIFRANIVGYAKPTVGKRYNFTDQGPDTGYSRLNGDTNGICDVLIVSTDDFDIDGTVLFSVYYE